ncbi:MAG: nicotinate-nucleotide--dimethylbenzimidazole phosphoribosyltransferase, partial [Vulcanococcus sp.]
MTLRRLSGDPAQAEQWCGQLGQSLGASSTGLPRLLLLLAGTDTAAVPGISAAGSTPAARRQTAAADAELLLLGPRRPRPHALPPLPAGVSPALISHVVVQQLALEPLVVDLGVPVAPAVPHLRCGGGPARCLSGGASMEPERVQRLLALGRRWGERLAAQGAPVVLAECVPGGTTTAQALLQGLGVEATGLVSGSLRQPAHGLKGQLVAQGLAAAGLGPDPPPQAVLAAVGDPMQALAAGLLLGALRGGQPLLLAGGSQMAAVLALALALAPPPQRPELLARAAIGTTAWVAGEASSDLGLLLERIGGRWGQPPLAFASGLRFTPCSAPELLAYEQGYVKEGTGLHGADPRNATPHRPGRRPGPAAGGCGRSTPRAGPAPRPPPPPSRSPARRPATPGPSSSSSASAAAVWRRAAGVEPAAEIPARRRCRCRPAATAAG